MPPTLDTVQTPAQPVVAAPAAAPRVDLYDPIHRALRLLMTDTLQRVGRLDAGDDAERDAVLAQLDFLLDACTSHLRIENAHVHPAIEARSPGASARVADEHEDHVSHIESLRFDAAQLQRQRDAASATRLYRHLALFVADNLSHMHVEETLHNRLLWSHYDDAELMAIHQGIVSSIPGDKMMALLRWMVPALPTPAQAELLGGMRQGLSPEAFVHLLDAVRPTLDDTRWARLARALGVAPVPGLVTV